jgi:hypothetical protein
MIIVPSIEVISKGMIDDDTDTISIKLHAELVKFDELFSS